MSFIQPPAQLTDKQKADRSGFRLVQVMKQECTDQFNIAWKKRVNGQLVDKTVEEAQAFFDQYGVKAALSFLLHGKLQELIYLSDDSWVALEPVHNYAPQQDGTVIISAKE